MGGGKTAGKAPRFRARLMAGDTFVIVELLDPSDSLCFKRRMRRKGLKDLTPPFGGNTFRSKHPTEDWMKQVANLDPNWWYISGHFARTPYYEALEEDQRKEKTIVPLFPKKKERWRIIIESMNAIKIGGLQSERAPGIGFGYLVKTKREIEIIVENNKFSGEGKTSFISVKTYSDPKDRYIYKPVTIELGGSGTVAEQEQWEWKSERSIDGRLRFEKWLMSKPKAFLKKLAKLESHKTPFCFPETYPVKVKKSGYTYFLNKKNQPEWRAELDLIFRSNETIDGSIGYVVASQWEPGQSIKEELDLWHNLKWSNPRDRARAIEYLKVDNFFRPVYDRFIFSEVKIMLQDGWNPKYDYPILTVGKVGSREEGLKRCPDGTKYSRVHPRSTEEITVKFEKRWVDRSADASFFNKSYYDNEYQPKQQSNPNSWRIRMEYLDSRDELKTENFFEEHGTGSYSNAKVVLLVSCNTLVLASVRKYLSQLFPKNAIILGHIHKNPSDATPIIRNFLNTYFSKPAKARTYDWEHIVTSWLSYHDKAKNSIMKRGYGLAAMYQGNVYGIDVDKSYNLSTPLAKNGQTIQRFRLKSIKEKGRKVDALLVWDSNGKMVKHEGMYEGDTTPTPFSLSDPYNDTGAFPFLDATNLLRNRGY